MAEGGAIELPTDGGVAQLVRPRFAPGAAPFRIKGNAYRGHVEFVDQSLPGGREAQSAAFSELSPEHGPAWSTFFAQPFLASSWYDIYPLAVAGIACARILGEPFLDFAYRRTCLQARADITGVYKFLLQFVSARQIAVRMPALIARYFDFGEVRSNAVDKATVVNEFEGFPVDLWPWVAALMRAYITTIIEITGEQAPRVEVAAVHEAGERDGTRLCGAMGIVELRHVQDQAKDPS